MKEIDIKLTREELNRIINNLDSVYQEYGCTVEEGKLVDKLKDFAEEKNDHRNGMPNLSKNC